MLTAPEPPPDPIGEWWAKVYVPTRNRLRLANGHKRKTTPPLTPALRKRIEARTSEAVAEGAFDSAVEALDHVLAVLKSQLRQGRWSGKWDRLNGLECHHWTTRTARADNWGRYLNGSVKRARDPWQAPGTTQTPEQVEAYLASLPKIQGTGVYDGRF